MACYGDSFTLLLVIYFSIFVQSKEVKPAERAFAKKRLCKHSRCWATYSYTSKNRSSIAKQVTMQLRRNRNGVLSEVSVEVIWLKWAGMGLEKGTRKCKIWGFHGGENQECRLLGFCAGSLVRTDFAEERRASIIRWQELYFFAAFFGC
jgi:hypothetical protein